MTNTEDLKGQLLTRKANLAARLQQAHAMLLRAEDEAKEARAERDRLEGATTETNRLLALLDPPTTPPPQPGVTTAGAPRA